MTANEMKYELDVILDRVSNLDAPSINDLETSLILSRAEERFLLNSYSGNNVFKHSFEETEKKRKDLSNLVDTAQLTIPSSLQNNTLPNSTFFDLPENCLYVVHEHIIASSEDKCLDKKQILVKPVTHDHYNIQRLNPFKRPDDTLCWRLDYKQNTNSNLRRHEIITSDNYSVETYFIRFLSKLPGIVVDTINPANQINSILDDSTHRRVIDLAVEIAIESLQDPNRLQTNSMLNTKNE